MNEIVEHNNNMNTVALRRFTPVELDLFMTICHKMKRKSIDILTFSFNELKELCGFTSTDTKDFVNALDNTYNKLIQTNIKIGDDVKWTRFVLFTKYTIDIENKEVTIGVNKEFQYILNDLSSEFTRFELKEFVDLKSSYAKECYRRLKQFRTTGIWKVKIDEFRRILDIPKGYKMGNIDQKVLKPIKEELSPLFGNLKITKIKKKGRGRGGVVDRLEFTFDKEIVISNAENQEKYIEPKSIGRSCPQCGKPLYELFHNGSVFYGHYFHEQGEECKAKFKTIAEIDGVDETPTRTKEDRKPCSLPPDLQERLDNWNKKNSKI